MERCWISSSKCSKAVKGGGTRHTPAWTPHEKLESKSSTLYPEFLWLLHKPDSHSAMDLAPNHLLTFSQVRVATEAKIIPLSQLQKLPETLVTTRGPVAFAQAFPVPLSLPRLASFLKNSSKNRETTQTVWACVCVLAGGGDEVSG